MRPACVLRPQPPRLGTPVVREQAGRLFYRSTCVPLVFSAPNLRAWDHRSSANKRDACSTVAHASRLCCPPPTSAPGNTGRPRTSGTLVLPQHTRPACVLRPQPPRLGSPVVREQAGRLFYRSTRVSLVFSAPNHRAWDHRSSANKRDACSTVAHASRLCSPPPTTAPGNTGRPQTSGTLVLP